MKTWIYVLIIVVMSLNLFGLLCLAWKMWIGRKVRGSSRGKINELEPLDFDESNLTLKPPTDMPNCMDLSVFYDKQQSTYISCWQVTKEDLEAIKKEGRIWLGIIGTAHPPVFLTTTKPIETGEQNK